MPMQIFIQWVFSTQPNRCFVDPNIVPFASLTHVTKRHQESKIYHVPCPNGKNVKILPCEKGSRHSSFQIV